MNFISKRDQITWEEKVAATKKAIQSQMPRRSLILQQPMKPLSRDLQMRTENKKSRQFDVDVPMNKVDKTTTDLDSITDVTSQNVSDGKKSPQNFTKYCRDQLD